MRVANTTERQEIAGDLLDSGDLQCFDTYFDLYDSLTTSEYTTIEIEQAQPALKSHNDIRKIALALRSNTRATRQEFASSICPHDQDLAINLAVQLISMIDCFDKHRHSDEYHIGGFRPVYWKNSERFVDFVMRTFPIDQQNQLHGRTAMKEKSMLKCWKLRKRAHIKFLPTDNLAEHLLYDPYDNVVRIFRQIAFLKAQLRLSVKMPLDCGISESLASGALPPRLILETLHSLQSILFPLVDEKSSRFLETLISDSKPSFDPNCLLYEGYSRTVPEDFVYQYWGNRLAKLHHVVTNPKPTHRIGQWIQRHASERNALSVAILSLVLTAFFGFLSVILAFVQTWIAYKSWKAQSS